MGNTDCIKNWGWTQMLRKVKLYLLYMWLAPAVLLGMDECQVHAINGTKMTLEVNGCANK